MSLQKKCFPLGWLVISIRRDWATDLQRSHPTRATERDDDLLHGTLYQAAPLAPGTSSVTTAAQRPLLRAHPPSNGTSVWQAEQKAKQSTSRRASIPPG